MPGKRIEISGSPVPFTCENSKFRTDLSIPPKNPKFPGSVTENPIYEDDQILLLERVENIGNGNKCFWFMWYDYNGIPVMPMSGVIDADDIAEVIRNISKISF